MSRDPVSDLVAEQAELDGLLAALTPAQWAAPSRCEGWSVADVVLHLAQTEEAVVATLGVDPSLDRTDWAAHGDTVEGAMDALRRGAMHLRRPSTRGCPTPLGTWGGI